MSALRVSRSGSGADFSLKRMRASGVRRSCGNGRDHGGAILDIPAQPLLHSVERRRSRPDLGGAGEGERRAGRIAAEPLGRLRKAPDGRGKPPGEEIADRRQHRDAA